MNIPAHIFAPDGLITERIMLGKFGEVDHWWFKRGTPVRRVAGRTETAK